MGAGRNSHFGWVQETTWGTVVTPPTKHVEILSENLKGIRTRTARPVIRDLDVREGNFYDEKFGVAGPVAWELNYNGMLRILEHLTGTSPTATAFDAGARNEFLFTQAAGELMAGKGLTTYLWKDVAASYSLQASGCKIRSAKFTFDPTRNSQIEVDFVGKDYAFVAETAPTLPNVARYCAGHQVVVQFDTVARSVDSVELTIDNALDDDKRVLGQKQIAEPVRNDRRSITGIVTVDAVSADFDKFNAGTLFRLDVLHTGPVLGTGNYKLNFTAIKCLITEDPIQVENSGIVKSTIPFTVLKPTAGSMLDILASTEEAVIA